MSEKMLVENNETFSALKWAIENKYRNLEETDQLEILKMCKSFLHAEIHDVLNKRKIASNNLDTEAELEIREYVKYVIKTLLPLCTKKITEYSAEQQKKSVLTQEKLEMFNEWLNIEDDLMALASYRSLTHLALYLERSDNLADKVWTYIMNDVMGGIFYYANSMILDNKYQNLIKQCPTGYGKSKSDCVIIAFIFGYDPNATVMKIIGNPSLLGDITEKIVKMLMSERFGKVFPEFGKYEGKKTMFKTLKIADGTFLLKDSKQGISFECSNKESSLDGTRFDYQFYDDITQSKDRENVNAHMKDRDKFTGQWRKRAVSEFTTKRFFTGTAYHREDLLSYVRNLYANDKPIVKDINTINFGWNKWCYISQDRKTIYVLVKKLADLELGENRAYVTFPQKFSKEEAIKMYHGKLGSIREFWAMEQQQPLPPESLAFDWAYLKQYVTLPENIRKGDCECHAIIDPSRKGYDNFSCLIFKKGVENGEERWYLTDCFYRKVSSKVAIPEVADRLKFHNVDVIHLENNIDIEETLEHYLLEKLMYNNYTIDSFYSTEKKEDKISMKRDDIKSMLVFPQQGMYSPDSDMGQAMQDIVSYSFTVKNQHDDSIDCCAMFVSQLDQSGQNEMFILSKNFFLN